MDSAQHGAWQIVSAQQTAARLLFGPREDGNQRRKHTVEQRAYEYANYDSNSQFWPQHLSSHSGELPTSGKGPSCLISAHEEGLVCIAVKTWSSVDGGAGSSADARIAARINADSGLLICR